MKSATKRAKRRAYVVARHEAGEIDTAKAFHKSIRLQLTSRTKR